MCVCVCKQMVWSTCLPISKLAISCFRVRTLARLPGWLVHFLGTAHIETTHFNKGLSIAVVDAIGPETDFKTWTFYSFL